MGTRIYQIFQGPVAATPTVTILGTASAGNQAAPGVLVHPDAANFPPITYPLNPDRVVGLDNEALVAPIGATVLTLSSRILNQFGSFLSDVVVTETWEASGSKVLPTFFARLLFEYFANPPAFAAVNPTFIQWSPSYRTNKTYNVQIIDFTIGGAPGGDPTQRYDWTDVKPAGGKDVAGCDSQHGFDVFDLAGGGFTDRSYFLQMKIVSEVT